MGVGASDRLSYRFPVLLLADSVSRRKDAVIYRGGLSNKVGSLALRLRDESNNLAHIRATGRSEENNQSYHGRSSSLALTSRLKIRVNILNLCH